MRRPRARIRVAQGPRLHLHATATARVAAASADVGVEARRDSGFAISLRAAVVDAAEKVREGARGDVTDAGRTEVEPA